MANTNQGTRAGQVFGRLTGDGFAGNDWENVVLKPGYIIKIRDRFALVEAVEGLSIDLYFNDAITVTGDGSYGLNNAATDESDKVAAYGEHTMNALLGIGTSVTQTAARTTVLSPDYDSGYTVFSDLEPFKGHLYHLCPSLPAQPKYISQEGNIVTRDGILPSASASNTGIPIGFPGAVTTGGGANAGPAAGVDPVGSVSPKLYIKHPAGVPKFVLDESPESESGSTASGSLLGLSGFIDAQISPVEDPDWSYSMWIEHGENNLPAFRAVVDCEEYILDGRVRLQGWKYRIVELTMSQLRTIRERSGGRLVFKVINPAGLPTAGTMLSEYFPQ